MIQNLHTYLLSRPLRNAIYGSPLVFRSFQFFCRGQEMTSLHFMLDRQINCQTWPKANILHGYGCLVKFKASKNGAASMHKKVITSLILRRPSKMLPHANLSILTVTILPPILALFIISAAWIASSLDLYLTVPKPLQTVDSAHWHMTPFGGHETSKGGRIYHQFSNDMMFQSIGCN